MNEQIKNELEKKLCTSCKRVYTDFKIDGKCVCITCKKNGGFKMNKISMTASSNVDITNHLCGETIEKVNRFHDNDGLEVEMIITFASGKTLTIEAQNDEDVKDSPPQLDWRINTPISLVGRNIGS